MLLVIAIPQWQSACIKDDVCLSWAAQVLESKGESMNE